MHADRSLYPTSATCRGIVPSWAAHQDLTIIVRDEEREVEFRAGGRLLQVLGAGLAVGLGVGLGIGIIEALLE